MDLDLPEDGPRPSIPPLPAPEGEEPRASRTPHPELRRLSPELRRPEPAAPAPLDTTAQETRGAAASAPSAGDFRANVFDMDDFVRRDPPPVAGNTALAEPTPEPAPAPTFAAPLPAPAVDRVAEAIQRAHPRFAPAAPEAPAPEHPIAALRRRLAADRGLQMVVVAAFVAVVIAAGWWSSRGGSTVSIASLQSRAAEMDGRTVTVKGRVGEVFQMGSSYAFHLHQGKDTLVVFTRSRSPVPRQRVTISGSLSTGYLEGVPRLALFEQGP